MKYAFVIAASFLCALGADKTKTTNVKKLNVAALDAGGQPVSDLRASDFQIFEDGKLQSVAFFRFTGGKTMQSTLNPGEISNRTGVPSHATVILVDLLSDRFLSGAVMGKEIGETLQKLETSDDVYLYFLTAKGEVFPVHGLPEPDTEQTPSAEPWTRNAGPMLDLAVKKLVGFKPVDDHDIEIRFKATAGALDALGGRMWQMPGRKNLVWVTHGVQIVGYSLSGVFLDFTDPMRRLAGKLEEAQIAVYTVQQSMRGAGESLDSYGDQTLDLFSSLTGGRLYRTDYVSVALQQARTDSRGNYEIGYDSEALNGKGKRHKIRVVCARKDVKLQTEQEFYALGQTPPADDFERAALETAAASPVDVSEIALRGSVSTEPGAGLRLHLQIASEDLLLRPVEGRYMGKVSVNYSTSEGQAFRPIPLNVNLTAQQYAAAGREGITVEQDIPKGAREVRAIVVDGELRAVGSITIPIGR